MCNLQICWFDGALQAFRQRFLGGLTECKNPSAFGAHIEERGRLIYSTYIEVIEINELMGLYFQY